MSTPRRESPPLSQVLRDPRLALMLALGFSSGLPFLLIFSTQSVWLREVGVSRSAIGLMSYAALAFAFKFAWAPIIDRFDPPGFGALLGRRRGWMLTAQIGVALGLAGLAFGIPAEPSPGTSPSPSSPPSPPPPRTRRSTAGASTPRRRSDRA